jgi:predicted hydrocarbon binding protein
MMDMGDKEPVPFEKSQKDPRIAFFIMPTILLRTIRQKAVKIVGDDVVGKLLYDCGVECGRAMVSKMDLTQEDHVDLGDTLTALWIEIGLGRLQVRSSDEDEVVLACDDSTEAVANGVIQKKVCDLTRGYLVGIASTLGEREWECTERICLSNGDAECQYVLKAK